AKKFDDRFDVSCDKDTACPPRVTGWATVKVYGDENPPPAQAVTVVANNPPSPRPAIVKTARSEHVLVFPARAIAVLNSMARAPGPPAQPTTTVAHGPTTVAQRLAKLASLAKTDATTLAHDAFVRRVAVAAKSSSVPQRLAS